MLEVVPRDWNRVGAMTTILKGLLGEAFDLVLFYAVILQAAFDTKVSEKFFDEFNGLAVCLESAEFLDVQTAGEPHAHVQAGLVFRIEVHDVREAERVGKAVMDTANGRERMRQGMSGAKIFLEGNGAHGSRDKHVTARGDVLAIFVCAWQGIHDQVNAFKSDPIAKWVKGGRGERFNAVGESIHAGGGSKLRGEFNGQFRIQNDEAREEIRMENDNLAMSLDQSND